MDKSKINSNLEDKNYVLESPYRGVEKMRTTLNSTIGQEKDYNFSLPIFLGNIKIFFMIQKYINQNLCQR